MLFFLKLFSFFLFFQIFLCASTIQTFYGPLEIEEPVLLELIESPAFERLKSIHQYGVCYYTNNKEEYNRYEHSLGVFAILRLNNASLHEQIAGLLHDISHTVFSHVGDWIFPQESEEKDYQNSIHAYFLKKYGIEEILNKYGFTVEEVLPLENLFPMLEQKSPNLCADRIEYNIQGAFLKNMISQKDAEDIIKDLEFIEGSWVSHNPLLMKKIGNFSLFMTENAWGNKEEYITAKWLAEAILKGVELDEISYEEIHFGIDDTIWYRLNNSEDPSIKELIKKIANAKSHYSLSNDQECDLLIKSKFRGINPLILLNNNEKKRLTEIDPEFAEKYETIQNSIKKGWAIQFN